jgi:hypothetical protein
MWRAFVFTPFMLFYTMLRPLPVFSSADTVIISGTVYDLFTARPLPGVSVIHPKWGQTIATDALGRFTISALHRDTLFLFYPSYKTNKFSVADSMIKKSYVLQLGLEPLHTGLNQAVIIKAP